MTGNDKVDCIEISVRPSGMSVLDVPTPAQLRSIQAGDRMRLEQVPKKGKYGHKLEAGENKGNAGKGQSDKEDEACDLIM